MWQRDSSGDCPDEDEGNTTLAGGFTGYNITGLEEDSNYTVTVTATNVVGNSTTNNNIIPTTMEDGIATCIIILSVANLNCYHRSIEPSYTRQLCCWQHVA